PLRSFRKQLVAEDGHSMMGAATRLGVKRTTTLLSHAEARNFTHQKRVEGEIAVQCATRTMASTAWAT
ncbi:MAG TPA: hypothetical protein VF772_24740, partial [Terriglobales bacterium]